MKLGDIVSLKCQILGQPAGTRAYIYEEYSLDGHNGVSVITRNGEDLGGFSAEEQKSMLEYKHYSGFPYKFESVMKLSNDFRAGLFDSAFTKEVSNSHTCTKGHEKSCYYAKSDNCNCNCGGVNHGRFHK